LRAGALFVARTIGLAVAFTCLVSPAFAADPKIGAVTLAPSTEAGKSSGLTFHYPPYAVGPYVEGQYVAFVPWETLKPYVTPEGSKIFGGERPKGDDEDQ
jgi:hypothetical protein